MKKFSEQLHKKASAVKLRAAEKRELRERVVSYMEYHPLPQTAKKVSPAPLMTESYRIIKVPFSTLAKFTAAAFTVLIVSIPIMAERSVPGDGLYAVKVQFNEEIRSTLALDAYQKVEWETERLNRRIAEARLLASEGKLDEETEAKVAAAVRTHTENAKKSIEELRTEDADGATLASIEFDTTLEVQSTSLKDVKSNDQDSSALAQPIESPTAFLASVIDESRAQGEVAVGSTTIPAYDKIMARVELNTTRAYELLESIEADLEDQQSNDISRRLEDIGRTIEEAIKLREENNDDARKLLVEALQRTQRLIVFMTDIEVIQTIEVEEIVPVMLTPEEKQAKREALKTELANLVSIVEQTLETEDIAPEIAEKVSTSIATIKTQQALMTEETPFIDYVTTSEDLLALAKDSAELLNVSTETPPNGGDSETEGTDGELIEYDMETPTSTEDTTEPVVATTTASSSIEIDVVTTVEPVPELEIPQL